MKPTLPNLTDHVSSEVTSLIICCKLTLTSGTVMGFTNNSESIVIDGVPYKATTLLASSGIETTNSFSVDNLDITGILDSNDIKEHDILTGKYDLAEIEVFTTATKDTTQKMILRRGWLGEITLTNGQFVAEVRGLTQKLQCNIGEVYTPSCRAVFGDSRCKADLKQYTFSGVVDKASNRQIFMSKGIEKPAGYFALGEIIWLTGRNAKLRAEVKEFADRQFILSSAMPHVVRAGDTFSAIAGCDKAFATCCNKFRNAINYRGEPHVPGFDRIHETGATAKS